MALSASRCPVVFLGRGIVDSRYWTVRWRLSSDAISSDRQLGRLQRQDLQLPPAAHRVGGEGALFRFRCDTMHAYARWGTDCLNRLHGLFSVGFYDRTRQRLIVAGDPLGIKALDYAYGSRGLVLASELRVLAASGLIDRSIDGRALAGLLAFGAVQAAIDALSRSVLA